MAALRVVALSYPVALLLLTVPAVLIGGEITAPAVYWGLLCGVAQAFGVWWFYAALAHGPISVVSPLTAILVAGVPVAFGMAYGERPSPTALSGIGVALAAVFLVSRDASDEDTTPHRFTRTVAWLTVGSGVAFGLNFVLLDQVPVAAQLWPLVFGRISASVLILLIAAATGSLRMPTGEPRRLALLAAVLDSLAGVATLYALHTSLLSLAGVLISLYPAGTVLLAIVVLKERVTRWQVLGMVLALVAVAMIALG